MKKIKAWLMIATFILVLSACSAQPEAVSIPTEIPLEPAVTSTQILIMTPTIEISPTSIPSPTVTPQPTAVPFKNPGEEIKIAALMPLSGGLEFLGQPGLNGAQLAIENWNMKGGVLGSKISLLVEDTQAKTDIATTEVTKLIQIEQIHYILGEMVSPVSVPISQMAEHYGVVQISPSSSREDLTINPVGKVKKFVFRTCFIDPYQGTAMAKYALGMELKTAFLLYDNGEPFSSSLVKAFEKTFTEGGGKVVGKVGMNSDNKDFSQAFEQLKQSNADLIYMPYLSGRASMGAEQFYNLGLKNVLMGGNGWVFDDNNQLYFEGGLFTTDYIISNPSSQNKEFVEQYKSKYGKDPDAFVALGFDSANLLLTAIDKGGKDDPAVVKDILASIEFEGVTGMIRFDKMHNPQKSVVIAQFKNKSTEFVGEVTP